MTGTRAVAEPGWTSGDPGREPQPFSARYAGQPARPRARQAAPPRPGGEGQRQFLTGILIAGAHGGAGTSTLAALLRDGLAGPGQIRVRVLPALPDGDPAAIAARLALPGRIAGPLIVTARGNAEGIRRAVITVTALGYRRVRPTALAVVSDGAGPLPKAAAQRLDMLGDRAGTILEIPFAATLRAAASPSQARLPMRLIRAITELADLAVPLAESAQ